MSQIISLNTGGVVPPGTAVVTITGNTGGPVPPDAGGNIDLVFLNTTVPIAGFPVVNTLSADFGISNLIIGSPATSIAGATNNVGLGNRVLEDLTSGTQNVGMGSSALLNLTTGSNNVGIGYIALPLVTNGFENVCVGTQSGFVISSGNNNSALGNLSLLSLTIGQQNSAFGSNALSGLTTGSFNSGLGAGALAGTTGSYNTTLGYLSGTMLTTGSSNILINSDGANPDSNTLRIGMATGGGNRELNRAFIQGIYNITPAIASPKPVVIDSAGQLGTDSGAGILLTLTGNTGGAIAPIAGNINIVNANTTVDIAGTAGTLTQDFGITNLILGSDAASIAGAIQSVGLGQGALNSLSSGVNNVALGFNAGTSISTGENNTVVGTSGGSTLSTGVQNVSLGTATSFAAGSSTNVIIGFSSSTTGNQNVVVGSGSSTGSGTYNTILGTGSGASIGAGVSNIILGGNIPGAAVSNRLRIGRSTGSAFAGDLSSAFICGIDGVNVGSVAKVVTMASDQLGTATITAGTNISVTPGANTITIAALGGGVVTWSVISANQTAAVNNGYFCNKAGTLTLALPATSAVGDVIEVTNENSATGIQFTQAAGQQILIGNTNTTLGATGTLTSSAVGDTLKIVCKTANTIWRVSSGWGNWTPA